MLERISWRIKPIEKINKHKQYKHDMWEQHEKFAEYMKELRKKQKVDDNG